MEVVGKRECGGEARALEKMTSCFLFVAKLRKWMV